MKRRHPQYGYTILELLVTFTLLSAIMGIAVSNLRSQADPLSLASTTTEGFLKQMRAKAISSTQAYTVYASANNRIASKYSNKCSDTTKTVDTRYFLNMPTSVTLTTITWSICFNSRGFPDSNVQFVMKDSVNKTKTLEVMLGGSVRTL